MTYAIIGACILAWLLLFIPWSFIKNKRVSLISFCILILPFMPLVLGWKFVRFMRRTNIAPSLVKR